MRYNTITNLSTDDGLKITDVFIALPNGAKTRLDFYLTHMMKTLKHFDTDTNYKFTDINDKPINPLKVNELIELNVPISQWR